MEEGGKINKYYMQMIHVLTAESREDFQDIANKFEMTFERIEVEH